MHSEFSLRVKPTEERMELGKGEDSGYRLMTLFKPLDPTVPEARTGVTVWDCCCLVYYA